MTCGFSGRVSGEGPGMSGVGCSGLTWGWTGLDKCWSESSGPPWSRGTLKAVCPVLLPGAEGPVFQVVWSLSSLAWSSRISV